MSEPEDIDFDFRGPRFRFSLGRWMLSVSERRLGDADDVDGPFRPGTSLNVSVLAILLDP